MAEDLMAAIERAYRDERRGFSSVGQPLTPEGFAQSISAAQPEAAEAVSGWLQQRPPDPEAPSTRRQPTESSPELEKAIQAAYGRELIRRQKAGLPSVTPGTYVDHAARRYEEKGDREKGRRLRDVWAQQQASKLEETQKAEAEALQAAGGSPTMHHLDQEQMPGHSNVDPRLMVDALEAVGVRTEGLIEPRVRQEFYRQFGDQIRTDDQAQRAAEHMWVKRGNEMQVLEAKEYEKDNPGLPPIVIPRHESSDTAKPYIASRIAVLDARKKAEAAENPARHTAANIMGSVARGITGNVPWQMRDDDLTAEDSVNAFLAAVVGQEEAAEAMFNEEERQALAEYRDTSKAVAGLLTFAELYAAGAGPLKAIGAGAARGLQAAKASMRTIRMVSSPIALGVYSAMSTDGGWEERAKAGLHGVALAAIAGNAGRSFHKALKFVPTNTLKAAAAEAAAFVVAEYTLSGFELTEAEAFDAAVLGAAMGASGASDPMRERLKKAVKSGQRGAAEALKVYDHHQKTLRKLVKEAQKNGWTPPATVRKLKGVPPEVLRGQDSGVRVPEGTDSALAIRRPGEVDSALKRARRLTAKDPTKSPEEVVRALDLGDPALAAEVQTRLGAEVQKAAEAVAGKKPEPTKPKPKPKPKPEPTRDEAWDALLAKARRIRGRGQGRRVGRLARQLKTTRDVAEGIDNLLRAEHGENQREIERAQRALEGMRWREAGAGIDLQDLQIEADRAATSEGKGFTTAERKANAALNRNPEMGVGTLGRILGVSKPEAERILARIKGTPPEAPPETPPADAARERARPRPPEPARPPRGPDRSPGATKPARYDPVGLTETDVDVGMRIQDADSSFSGVVKGTRMTKDGPVFIVESNDGRRIPIPGSKARWPVKRKSMFARNRAPEPPPVKGWRRPEGFSDEQLTTKAIRKMKVAELRTLAEGLELSHEGITRRKLVKDVLAEVAARKQAELEAKPPKKPEPVKPTEEPAEPAEPVGAKPAVEEAPPPEATKITTAERPRLDTAKSVVDAAKAARIAPDVAKGQAGAPKGEGGATSPEVRIAEALRKIAKPVERVRLKDIRALVPELSDAEWQKAMENVYLSNKENMVLWPIQEPWSITPADDAAQWRTPVGDRRDIAYVNDPPKLADDVARQFGGAGAAPTAPAKASTGYAAGEWTTVRSETGDPVDAQYVVVEGKDLLPSHRPEGNGYRWSEGYPRENNLQERDYATGETEAAKVDSIRTGLHADEVLSTGARATEGSPTISPDGTVLNGNARAIGILNATPLGKEAYRKLLVQRAGHFGVDREAIEGMKEPVLVRKVEMDPRTAEAATFARTGQESGTASQTPTRAAARYEHLLGEDLFQHLRDTETATVGEAVNDKTKGADFRDSLYKAIPKTERDLYFRKDRTLTGAGKELVEDMLLVRGLTDQSNAATQADAVRLIERMPPALRNTMRASSVQLVNMARTPDGARHIRSLMEATGYWIGPMGETRETPKEFFGSLHFANSAPPPISAEGRMMLDFVHQNRASPVKFRKGMKRLVEIREQESGLFAGESDFRQQMATALEVDYIEGGKIQDQTMFGFPDVFSPERLSELPPGWNNTPPDPVLGGEYAAPNRRTAYAQDMPMPADPTADYAGKKVSSREVIQHLEGVVGTPIRVGHLGIAQIRAAGVYQVGPEIVRLRMANDMPTAAHETAHAIEKAVFWNAGRNPNWVGGLEPRVLNEFNALGRALYGSRVPQAGYAREGFAEFVRFRLTDPAKVRGSAAEKWWNDTFLADNPKLAKRFAAAERTFNQWQAQGHENRRLADIDRKKPGRIRSLAQRLFNLKSEWVESADILRVLTVEAEARAGRKLAPHESPYDLLSGLRLTHTARTRYMVDSSMIDIAGNITGTSLREAAAIVSRQNRDPFTLYLWARRAKERILGAKAAKLDWSLDEFRQAVGAGSKELGRVAATIGRPEAEVRMVWEGARKGGNPGMGLNESMELIERLERPEFLLAADKVYTWNQRVLEYAVQGGAITPEEFTRILGGSEDYVPLQRSLENMTATDAKRVLQGGQPLKKFRGSGEAIRDPFDVMIENTEKIVRWTHEKMVTNALARLVIPRAEGGLGVEGLGPYITEIPPSRVKEYIPVKQIEAELRKAGADTDGMAADALIERYRPVTKPKDGAPIVTIRDAAGKVRWFEVNRDVWDGLESMDVHNLPKAVDLTFGTSARALRLGTTGLRASFALGTNPVRDFATGYMQSTTTSNPAVWAQTWLKSYGESFLSNFGKEFPYQDLFRRMGGEMAQSLGIDTRQTRRAARELFTDDSFKGRTVRVLRSPVDHLRDFLQFPENATRVAEVKRMAKDVGYEIGQRMTMDQALQMLIAGKRVSIDFTAAGRMGRTVNQLLPFFNASVQGVRSMARRTKDAPVSTTLKGLATRTLPALALWWMNKDEDWYRDMPVREKFSYFWHDVGADDELIAIPRAFDWDNVFSVVPEALVDAWYQEDPESVVEALGHIWETSPASYFITPWEHSPLTNVPLELYSNKSSYTGAPIVPRNQADLAPREKVAPYSSGIARWLGKANVLGPREIDHVIRGFTGGVIHDTAGWVDWAANAVTGENPGIGYRSPSRGDWKDIPLIGQAFARRGGKEGRGSKAVNLLWEELIEARQVEGSTIEAETKEQRAYRMRLEDAAIAIKFLRKAQGHKGLTKGKAAEIQRKIREIAQEAVGTPDGGRLRRAKREAKALHGELEEGSSTGGGPGRSMFGK